MRLALEERQAEVLHRRRARLRQRARRAARRRLRVPRRRAQAGAVLRVLSDGGGAHQRARRRERDARGDRARGAAAACVLSTDKAVYPINAMGMSKAMMEKVMVAKSRLVRPGQDGAVRHALRQRDGLARLGHSAVPAAAARRQAADDHRSEHDALPDVARRVGRPGAVRVRACAAGRHLRAEGAGLDRRRPGAGAARASRQQQRDQDHRHAPRRKAVRVAGCRARRWRAPRTWAATTAFRPTRAT